MRLPAAQKRVEAELAEARKEIEGKLAPDRPELTRHLALPPTGRTPEWIVKEMDKMNAASGKQDSWKEGRMSGAVYRSYFHTHLLDLFIY